MYLEKINSPNDLKKIGINDLDLVSAEIRGVLLDKLSKLGGHIAPNFGIVELTVALHYVFNSPVDKIVFDVSHQTYVHKIITGRKYGFLNEESYAEITGFSSHEESAHDLFTIGHTSTSLSLACGLAKARDLKGGKENIIAVIGDGSLSGGEAYEGLNNIVEIGTNLIVIVNDNQMSIAENHGGLYNNLAQLRLTKGKSENNFFKSLGFEYFYIENGHDYKSLIAILSKVKDIKKPVIVHVHTIKGKGLSFAERDKETWHYGAPFNKKTGEFLSSPKETYSSLTGKYLLEKIKQDRDLVIVNSGTPSVINFTQMDRAKAGKQYVDVGIAEEHAVAFASGIAKNEGRALYAVYSSFLQRSYDQISQDLCINNTPATILVFGASVYGMKDKTHLGIFDIPLLSNIPNLVYLAPTYKEEYFHMLEFALHQRQYPIFIRVPGNGLITKGIQVDTDYSLLNKSKVEIKGEKVAIIALGSMFELGEKVTQKLIEFGIKATLINPIFISGIDENLLKNLNQNHELVITLEDGIIEGGYGQKIAAFYGTSKMLVKNYGLKKCFYDRFDAEELLKEHGITLEDIVKDVINIVKM